MKGARVPTLLKLNLTQSLSSLNLGEYTVLDCEPLPNIKGHLFNLFEELPHILPAEIRVQCQELIETNLSRETATGADIRMTAIHVLLLINPCTTNEARNQSYNFTTPHGFTTLFVRSYPVSPKP